MIDDSENIASNPRKDLELSSFHRIVEQRLSRRGFLASATATLAVAACATPRAHNAPGFDFAEITRGTDETIHIPDGYRADPVLKWGETLFSDGVSFDPNNQTVAAQRQQFGYNNDFIGVTPVPGAEGDSDRLLLCVNHEYTSTPLMFPDHRQPSLKQAQIEMAAHGGSVVEVQFDGTTWQPVVGSRFNRRIMADGTPMTITGPAAGHDRMKTTADPQGLTVAGTMNNCAGGMTPWGTYLLAEENFNGNFRGSLADGHPETTNHQRLGVPGGWYQWGRFIDRFDVAKEPNEPNRFGWIVEVDPADPTSTPKKRTALGRFKHEGAETVVAPDGRLVIYMGDDQQFEYVYKFVSRDHVDVKDRAANADLLDDGTLYVARFDDDGNLTWMPLVHGEGPLTKDNGFLSQADVVIEARRAADLLGATPMDRPEDVQPSERNGRAYVMLTNNTRRTEGNAANPRVKNTFGHVIEVIEPGGDFASTASRWELLVQAGDPSDASVGASFHPTTSEDGWFSCPDNGAIDPQGRLWVATDGNPKSGSADGLWAVETDGSNRGRSLAFFRAPVGAEVCGPCFTQDGRTLFIAVQHPGDGRGATYQDPTTRWPDFDDAVPPRPTVIAIRREDGGPIGG